jgi:hypothetical protein
MVQDSENVDDSELPKYESVLTPLPQSPDPTDSRKQVSEQQMETFRSYLDTQLLQISRKFIRRINGSSDGYESLGDLSSDLARIVDLIWYTVTSTTSDTRFQTDYMLRIAGDFLDYLGEWHTTEPTPDPKEALRLLQKLDNVFSHILDGEFGVHSTRTEAVRMESIAERTRVAVATLIRGWEFEVSRVYEKTLDRTS